MINGNEYQLSNGQTLSNWEVCNSSQQSNSQLGKASDRNCGRSGKRPPENSCSNDCMCLVWWCHSDLGPPQQEIFLQFMYTIILCFLITRTLFASFLITLRLRDTYCRGRFKGCLGCCSTPPQLNPSVRVNGNYIECAYNVEELQVLEVLYVGTHHTLTVCHLHNQILMSTQLLLVRTCT